MVVETGFPWKPQPLPDPRDYTRKLSLEESMTAFGYPLSQQGQVDFLRQLIQIVKETPGGKGTGVLYWAPEHIPIKNWAGPEEPDAADWYPRALFDDDGEMTLGMEAFED